MALHVVGLSENRELFHTIRQNSTTWDPWVRITTTPPSSPISIFDCATVYGQLHICAITDADSLIHTYRDVNGVWRTTWENIGVSAGLPNFEFRCVAVCGILGQLHICTSAKRKPTGTGTGTGTALSWPIFHAVRSSLTSPHSFSQQFTEIVDGLSVPEKVFSDISCAHVDGRLQMCALGLNDELWHTINFLSTTGTWQQFNDVRQVPGHGRNILSGGMNAVCCAGIGPSLHICAQVNQNLSHTIRINDRGWQREFGNVTAVMGNAYAGKITNIACANESNNLHICCCTNDGEILHTIRTTKPADWRNPETSPSTNRVFGDVTSSVGSLGLNPAPFRFVGVAGS